MLRRSRLCGYVDLPSPPALAKSFPPVGFRSYIDILEGGPTAALVAYHNPGIHVNVVDLNETRIATWNSPHLPIHEPGLSKIVRIGRDGTRASTIDLPGVGTVSLPNRIANLVFSTRVQELIAEADIVFICVNTPTKLYGIGAGACADLSILESAATMIAKHVKDDAIIVEKSTVPCGTARMIQDIVSYLFRFLCQTRGHNSAIQKAPDTYNIARLSSTGLSLRDPE